MTDVEGNIFIFPLAEMKNYVAMYDEFGDEVDWDNILKLKPTQRKIISIHVMDDVDIKKELASAVWVWKRDGMYFHKIEVDKSVRGQHIGPTIMKMVIAIAKFYGASKITAVIEGHGEEFLYDWYPKLGFTIYDGNKLLMEIKQE